MSEKIIRLRTPLNEEEIRELNSGEMVELSGTIFLARDRAHKLLSEKTLPEFRKTLNASAIYHCGPIAKKEGKKWKIISAGPTTSSRMEPYESEIIKNYGVKAIIGKGGMKEGTLRALMEFNAVYLLAVGGASALLAEKIVKVKNVFFLKEFGIPEAVWEVEVKNFPSIVSMDSKGESLHKEVLHNSIQKFKELLEK
ncbi:MAG: FumA C-terminus/TtdB family hydratase beta subunit [archaeon]|nr:FumA C-terminus/TtdB family hydratase beta subunit [Candidatus Micrarchaeota archaeon]